MILTQHEAEKLTRELKQQLPTGLWDAKFEDNVHSLCDHILSGSMKREIENAAFERAARWCEREDIERDPDDLYSGRAHRAAAIRALIQPPAQKENGE